MARAKYTIMIPLADNLGNELQDISTAAHKYLFDSGKVEGTYIEGPKKGNWRDDPQEFFEHLITIADDSPEMDSTIKHLALVVARAANQWGVFCTKEGKDGIHDWTISNKDYDENLAAPVANGTDGGNLQSFASTVSIFTALDYLDLRN
jgi:hypothetical protein